jgi:uncharacterized membrane protein HdeD (DUF308 family)
MKKIKDWVKSYRFLQILTGIIYLIMALLAMRYTDNTIVESIQLVGGFSLIKGFLEIINSNNISKRTKHNLF